MVNDVQNRLAWHETLELHELLAASTVGVVRHKRTVRKIRDPELRQLYLQCIANDELQIRELAALLQSTQVGEEPL